MKLPKFIYRSERVGKNGKVFSALKIRTMKETTTQFATEDVYTKYGKWLRKTKLDEIMQLINVFKGEMSIVGVRPELKEHIDLIPKETREILLSRKPGLTSLSSLHFIDEESIIQKGKNNEYDYWVKIKPMKILLDVYYIQNRDFWLDIWIVWRTAILVLKSLL